MSNMYYVEEPDAEQLSEQMRMNLEQKAKDMKTFNHETVKDLIMTGLPIHTCVNQIDQYPNQIYALLRKAGLGGSDSSALLGVNPYHNRQELIAEKARNYLTEDELKVGDLVPVKKGRDLEPIIIDKFKMYLGKEIMKPCDMYRFNDYPWLTMNFDGVVDKTNEADQYIPCEIKVVTKAGERHYDKTKAWFGEPWGFGAIPEDVSQHNWSIQQKAAHYGIPPYYYTQLQQEIMALDAPFGYLTSMWDNEWTIYSFFVWKDQNVQNALAVEGYKTWNQIEALRGPTWKTAVPEGVIVG